MWLCLVKMEKQIKYCKARYLPLNSNFKDYTFATTIEGLEPGDSAFYISNDILHEVVFCKYVKKPRKKYHYKMLIGRRCNFYESIATASE